MYIWLLFDFSWQSSFHWSFSAFPLQNRIDGTHSFVSNNKNEKVLYIQRSNLHSRKTKNRNKKIFVLTLFVSAKAGENYFVFHFPGSFSVFINCLHWVISKSTVCRFVVLYFCFIQCNSNKQFSLFYFNDSQSKDIRDKKNYYFSR